MTCWVYFLLCDGGYLYTGVANDPIARAQLHAIGRGARFTRIRHPIHVIGALPFSTRSEALSMEHRIKRFTPVEKRNIALSASHHPAWLEFSTAPKNSERPLIDDVRRDAHTSATKEA